MGKKKLTITPPAGPEFELIAISSVLSPSRMLLLIERSMGQQLSLRPTAQQLLGYAVFASALTSTNTMALIPNAQPSGERLVRQLPKVDYLLELSGDDAPTRATHALRTLQQADGVQAAIRVQPSSIKRTTPFWME